ncbi:hypothetical protein GCM10020258_35700 [Sphingomonas yabuuchiae]
MVTLAVDQHERLVRRQPAQGGWADERLPVRRRQALHVEGGQQLRQRVVQIARHARADQRFGEHVDGGQRIELRPAPLAGAGDDHIAVRARLRHGLRPGCGGKGQMQRHDGAGGNEFHDEAFPIGDARGACGAAPMAGTFQPRYVPAAV